MRTRLALATARSAVPSLGTMRNVTAHETNRRDHLVGGYALRRSLLLGYSLDSGCWPSRRSVPLSAVCVACIPGSSPRSAGSSPALAPSTTRGSSPGRRLDGSTTVGPSCGPAVVGPLSVEASSGDGAASGPPPPTVAGAL